MSQDESKFDTMRLISGAEASDLYSLEDIVREFSTDEPKRTEASASSRQKEEAPVIKSEEPEPAREEVAQEEAAPAEKVEAEQQSPASATAAEKEEAPETAETKLEPEPEPEPPAYENLSEQEMADAIAQAVAHSIEERPVVTVQETEAAAVPPQAAEKTEPTGEPDVPVSEEPQQAAQAEPPQSSAVPMHTEASAQAKPEQQRNATPKKQRKRAPKPQAANPGTEYQKIPRSHVTVSAAEYIGQLRKEIHERQAQALPKPGTSLRGTEKRLAAITGIDRMLSPLRYLILLLMVLCIGGRSVSWMTLGFMTGMRAGYIALAATIIVMLLDWQSILRAVQDVWYLRASYETFLLLTTLLSIIELLVTKNENTYLPILTIAWCLTGTAGLMHNQATLRSLRAVITGRGRKGIRTAREQWEHTDVIGKAPVTTAGFVRHQAQPDVWHNGMGLYLPFLLLVSIVASAYLSAKTQQNYLTVLVTILDVAAPVSLCLCCARPYSLLTRALKGKGAVAGWFGMKGLYGKKAMMIYDSDLFPEGTMQQTGVRAYGSMDPRQLVSYGASMALRANVGFQPVFTKLLRDMNGEIYDVANFQVQETGLEGYIQRDLVHLGSYQYMQLMGVTLPKPAPKYGVYIAVNRQLAGLFGVKYQVTTGAKSGFRRLVREPRLRPLLVTRNFCVNPGFVEHWFGAPVAQMDCPKSEKRRALSEPSLLSKGSTCGFVLREGINAYSRTVIGARRVYRMGFWLTVCAAILSFVLAVQAIAAISSGATVIPAQRLVILNLILWLVVEVWARVALRK